MAILTRPLLHPQQRFDLEDLEALLSAARTDAKLYTKQFLSSQNYVLKGFSITGLGLNQATLVMADATLIIPQNSFDFSYFISAPTEPNIVIPASSLTDGVRNYVELSLATEDGTPLTRALWDPDANEGAGAEFNQIVNTVTDLEVVPVILTGGFSGLPDRLPVAILDVNGSGIIKSIFDRRELFFRLSKPENLNNSFVWGSKVEPIFAITLSGVTGTFVSGEPLTVNTETATCVGGGTTSITFDIPSGINFFPGSTVTGLTSGATGVIQTISESFSGVDKSILNQKNDSDAIKTEIKNIKGTQFWWQDASVSIDDLSQIFEMLRLEHSTTNPKQVLITAGEGVLADGTVLNEVLSDLLLSFDGAVIDFSTGVITKSDGITSLGINFTPATITANQYLWYSVTLIPGSINADNTITAQVSINPASSSNASPTAAPKASFLTGTHIGQVRVKESSGSIANIAQSDIIQVESTGAIDGGGGEGDVRTTYYDPVSTALPTGTSYTADGSAVVNGDLVLFSNLSSGNLIIYKVSGVGTSLAWAPQTAFGGSFTPSQGDAVRIDKGTLFGNQLAEFNGTTFVINDIVRFFNGTDFWEQTSLKTTNIADNTTATVFSVNVAGSENFVIPFSIVRGSGKETGQIYISNNDVTVSVSKSSTTISGGPGVDIQASITTGVLTVQYVSDASGSTGTMKYFLQRWSDSAGGPSGVPSYSGGGGSSVAAAGSISDIQYKGSDGNLAGDDRNQWDSTLGAINLDGLKLGILSSPITVLDNQASPATLLSVSGSTFKHIIMEYSMEKDGFLRTGRILLTGIDGGGNFGFSDDSVESSTMGIALTAVTSGSNILLQYTTTNTGSNGTFTYSFRKWN